MRQGVGSEIDSGLESMHCDIHDCDDGDDAEDCANENGHGHGHEERRSSVVQGGPWSTRSDIGFKVLFCFSFFLSHTHHHPLLFFLFFDE